MTLESVCLRIIFVFRIIETEHKESKITSEFDEFVEMQQYSSNVLVEFEEEQKQRTDEQKKRTEEQEGYEELWSDLIHHFSKHFVLPLDENKLPKDIEFALKQIKELKKELSQKEKAVTEWYSQIDQNMADVNQQKQDCLITIDDMNKAYSELSDVN